MGFILTFLRSAMPALRLFAKSTPTQIDDAVVEILDAILANNGQDAVVIRDMLKSSGAIKPKP